MTPWHPKPMISNTFAGGSNATVATSATKFQKSAFDKSFSNSFFLAMVTNKCAQWLAGLCAFILLLTFYLPKMNQLADEVSLIESRFSYLQLIDLFQGVWKPMRVKNDLQVAFWNSYWKVGHAKLLFEGCLGQGANLESFGFCSAEPLTDHSLDHAMFRHGSRTAMALLFEVK